MTEREIKFRVPGHEGIRTRLIGLGADLSGRRREWNAIYDRPDSPLRDRGCALRLRLLREADSPHPRCLMTFKGPATGTTLRQRPEHEIVVSDFDEAARLLHALGFRLQIGFEKTRETWVLAGCRVELDTLPGLGCFVEIEGPDEGSIRTVAERLGFATDQALPQTYLEMLSAYAGEHGLDCRDLRFAR